MAPHASSSLTAITTCQPTSYNSSMSISNSMAKRSSDSTMNRSFSTPPPANESLPVFQTASKKQSSHSRLASISHNLRRAKSLSTIRESYGGRSVGKFWNWGWGWMFTGGSYKGGKAVLGGRSGTSWGDLVQKARLRFRKLLTSDYNAGQPRTCRYTSFDYSKNFDDGCGRLYE